MISTDFEEHLKLLFRNDGWVFIIPIVSRRRRRLPHTDRMSQGAGSRTRSSHPAVLIGPLGSLPSLYRTWPVPGLH